MIHARTLHALEYDRIQKRLADLCQSDCGRERALGLLPLSSEQEVLETQKLYDESLTFMSRPRASQDAAPGAFPDVTPFITAVRERGALRAGCDLDALFALRSVLLSAAQARDAICVDEGQEKWPRLMALATNPPMPQALTSALARCLNEDGLLRDEASPELFQVRVELRSLHQTAMRKTRSFAEKYNILPYLQDEFMTLSSDRYVLPFKANYKNKMQGILHDWSQTGETCYFEPMFLVELNNRIQELRREEREEERKVLLFLANMLEADSTGALAAVRLLTELDLLNAKRRLADLSDARMVPLTGADEGLLLAQARHPLLLLAERESAGQNTGQEARRGGALKAALDRVHPLDIVFRPGDKAVIVTGGNAGGKTVCLKTLGLSIAMTLAGLPVPVGAGSHLPWITRMDAFIGDEQSLEDNVSTFTAQIEHLAKAWKHLDGSGLVLLDEFGSGTDPAQGAALAQAVLDELLEKRTFVLTATHFPALKGYALAKEGARAASMLFDPSTRRPLYVLAYDQVGSSQALDVAREHGLPECVLRRAEHYLLQDGEDTSALLRRLNELALQRENELKVLKEEQTRARNAAQHSRERLDAERRRLHDEVRARAQELMRAVKEDKVTHKQALKQMAALRASLAREEAKPEEAPQAPARDLAVGDTVTHSVFRRKGVITEVDSRRGRVRLDMGGVSLWAEISVLQDLPTAVQPAQAPKGKTFGAVPAAAQAQSAKHAAEAAWSVDVRGMRAEEAVSRLQVCLDKAYLAEMREVEVVHGRGTGALRRAIHEWLAGCSHVSGYSLAPADRGGDGMTIVTLK
ncbi:MAG: Smr/MutS family protein [Desulfovibrionaceae bacterium]|nr:Smr/MutS family protein [Desulfovibrionaceae bacterium]